MNVQSNTRGVLASALVPLLIAAHLSSFAHMVLVQHSACPEHGELVHHADPAENVAPAPRPDTVTPTVAVANALAETEASHDHCLVLANRREEKMFVATSVALGNIIALPMSVGDMETTPFPSTSRLYRLAPKNSPPV
jgi:hypothetical protein